MYLTNLLAFLLVLLYSGTQVNGVATTFAPTTGTAFAIGSDASIVATIDVAASQTITVTYDLATAVSIGSIVVDHNAADGSKTTVTATAALADRYTITKTDDTTVTVVIKAIAATDDAKDLTFTSSIVGNTATTALDTKTGFSPASLTTGTIGSDFVITATVSVAADHTITVSYFDGNMKTAIGTITIASATSTVASDGALVAADYTFVQGTAGTITLTLKTYAESDFYSVFLFDSTDNNQDAVFVIGGISGASSLTCRFSMLLALAVALREFMSA